MQDKLTFIDPVYQHEFLLEIASLNLQRGKLFARVIIGIELILLLILLASQNKHTSFEYNWYAFMYLLMIIVTAGVLSIITYIDKHLTQDEHYIKTLEISLTSYAIFLMIWGAMVSFNDQALYGSIVIFIVNVFIASVMFYLKPVYTFLALLISSVIFFIGLPFYQPELEILIGHYVNTSVFLVFIFFLARANYMAFVNNFLNQKLIEEKTVQLTHANAELIKEIQSRKQTQKELETANEQLMIISKLDALTGIPNRRRLDEVLQEQWIIAMEKQLPISFMMIDIDFFKLYNDTYGHLAGDHCLQAVADVLHRCLRVPSDFVARFGGEEFLFIAVGMSEKETVMLGERIRSEIEMLDIEHKSSPVVPRITVSLGISHALPAKSVKVTKLLEQADEALYKAKSAGRNQLILAE